MKPADPEAVRKRFRAILARALEKPVNEDLKGIVPNGRRHGWRAVAHDKAPRIASKKKRHGWRAQPIPKTGDKLATWDN